MMKQGRMQKILLYVIGVLLVVTMTLSIVRQTRILEDTDIKAYSFFSTIKYTLIDHPIKSVVGWFDDYTTYSEIRKENEALRKEIDNLNMYKAQLMEANRQIGELTAILSLETVLSRYELINATVIGRDLSSWKDTILIDVGENDGIDENYAVVTPLGLIGRISFVNKNSSVVKLITIEDGSNKVSVKIQIDAEVTAEAYLETYDSEKKMFVLKLLSTGKTVTPGMTVITSGMGGVFPSGLLVGTVTEVSELENAVGMNVYVAPSADFSDFSYVSVVKIVGDAQ